ncbi:odorant receptor 22c-like [Ceratina calcarata]|uniref:Odorant receptor 22c-like n=1 Tax=Ceratina calcarata TaxID=156304 RepID=A0AAJ7NAC8_9HYME|nr:odorant receptor 22c-like [Ceratina calcarata]
MCVFIATDTILLYMVQHVCGLLSLAGHRFKYSMGTGYSLTNSEKINKELVYKKVCYAIKTHKRALTFLTEIESVYALNLFIQVGVVVLTFTITLLKVASVTLTMETYQYYGFLVTQLIHIFFLTVQGQFVIDLHDIVYQEGYHTCWYYADVRTQALLVLVLRRNLLPPLLTAGGLIQLKLDSFAEIVKASVSYFTVLKSV